jgi:type VI secretion system protein ImpL
VTKILTIVGVCLALALAGLWAIDTFLGREKMKIVLMILLVFLGALLLIWLLIWLIRTLVSRLSAARKHRQEAAAAAPRTGATPQEQAELDSLQERLNTAARVLRESKLARGRKGDEVLYSLPWILLLGPSESGKTTVLQECGLDFPYTTAEGLRQRGAPPASCEYWFSRNGIVLDLAGRIGADEEWFNVFRGFLDQLKHARRERPIDGVVVTIDVADLLKRPAREVDRLANGLRQRLDEMIKRLGIRFPIYVLFTKCDQLEGFHQFFGNLRSRDRAQVWGATIPRALRRTMANEKIFAQEFDRLVESLSPFRLQLMASEQDRSKLPWIYAFPTRLSSLKSRLTEFMGTLLQPTPYSERPMFRGFYLTGASGSAVLIPEQQPAQPGWEPGRRLAAAQESPKLSKNYFLENLFPRIIFADRPLAMASVGTRLRRRLWMDIVFVTTILLCAILLVGMIFSYTENRALMTTARQSALRLSDAGWDGKRTTDLMAMEELRQTVEELDKQATEGPPWRLRWWLYSGGRINPPVRHVYFQRLRQSFVSPSAEALRQKLATLISRADSATSFEEFYTYLKAYLMMTEPRRSEESFLNNALAPIWKSATARDAEDVALRQLRFYARQLPKNEPELQLTQDAALVARARRALSQFPVLDRLYNALKSQGNAKFQPYTLAAATGGKGLDFLSSSHDVPGVFTETAWRTYFKQSAAEASQAVVKDDWVVGPTYAGTQAQQVSDADYQKQILDRYFAEYSGEWLRFMEGISVQSLADLTEAREALNSFSQQDSPISRLLMNVAAQTMLRREPEKGGGIGDMVTGALATLGLTTKVSRDEMVIVVADQFAPLYEIVTSPDGKMPSISAQYVDVLGRVHAKLDSLFGAGTQWEQVKAYINVVATNISGDEFHDAYRLTSRISQMCNTKSTIPVGPLVEKPLRQAWAAALRDAGYRLDGLWRQRVAEIFRREIESRYPFNPSGQDLPLSMLSQYLKPGQGYVWAFYESELKNFLRSSENGWEAATLMGGQVEFSPSFLTFLQKANVVQQAMYGAGSPEPLITFDLTPQPPSGGVTESRLEIDGQRLIYGNWAPSPQAFSWPGKAGAPQARISISITGTGERPTSPTFDGEWAFFRLLNLARVAQQSPTTYNVTWSLNSSDGRRLDVNYRLMARNVNNPFAPSFFAGIRCPDRVTQLPAAGQLR